MNDISSINEVEYSEKTGLAHYESEVERLDAALTKCSGDIRKIPVAMGLVDAIDKLQNRSHRVSGLMRSIICPVWGAASQNKNRMCSFPPEILPLELEALAHALDGFNTALRVLPGFNHIQSYAVEKVHQSLHAFKQDLQYRSYSMRQFPESFHRNAMRYYISTIAEEMSHQSHDVADALEVFFESGLYTIKYYERRPTFQNLSTVATLFAGVSASSIQFSFSKTDTEISKAVSLFWLLSLSFSIASAVSSQLSYHWSSTLWISSDVTPHWWTSAWILNAPLVLLLVSVASFVIGIILFAFSTFVNDIFIPILVVVVSVIWIMGLLFGFFIDPRVIMNRIAIKDLMGSVQTWIQRRPNIVGTDAQDQLVLHPTESSPDMNAPQHPRPVVSKTPAASQWTDIVPLLWKLDNTPSEYKSATSNFRRLVMRVVEDNRRDLQIRPNSNRERISRINNVAILLESHVEEWTGVHVSAVHDIRFSADGDYLATCAQDQKVVVWAMRPEVRIHFSSLCDPSTQPHRLSWHPKHLLLAVMLVRSANLVIYDLSGAGKPTVSSWSAKQRPVKAKQGPVRAVTWMPSKEALVYTEGHHVRCFNRDSEEWNIELPYSLDEVAVTPDGTKLVVVGTVDSVDVDGKQFKPSKSPPERRIIMIEIDGRAKIFETPTLNQVRGLDVSSSGALLLVTYEGKASPQLFRIHSTWLVLLQTYRPPKGEVEYSGYSQLGIRGWTSGVDGLRIDECAVMCADKEGSIFIWDRGSSDLLHTLKAPLSRASHLTGFAWNHGPIENPTIAASSANGTIWFYHPYGSGAGD